VVAKPISGGTDVIRVFMCVPVQWEIICSRPEGKYVCICVRLMHVCIPWKEAYERVEILVVYTRFTPQKVLQIAKIVSMSVVIPRKTHFERNREPLNL